MNSASAGLQLGLEALGVGPGDKAITTVHTFTATAEVIWVRILFLLVWKETALIMIVVL